MDWDDSHFLVYRLMAPLWLSLLLAVLVRFYLPTANLSYFLGGVHGSVLPDAASGRYDLSGSIGNASTASWLNHDHHSQSIRRSEYSHVANLPDCRGSPCMLMP
ncbi:hypothetical protein BJX61DRAFT_495116 [Aspergillus egyptiacus]|nr:hypothetical protein BJX61DRAFT_495116 [Aspergillus egyptiacus]